MRKTLRVYESRWHDSGSSPIGRARVVERLKSEVRPHSPSTTEGPRPLCRPPVRRPSLLRSRVARRAAITAKGGSRRQHGTIRTSYYDAFYSAPGLRPMEDAELLADAGAAGLDRESGRRREMTGCRVLYLRTAVRGRRGARAHPSGTRPQPVRPLVAVHRGGRKIEPDVTDGVPARPAAANPRD